MLNQSQSCRLVFVFADDFRNRLCDRKYFKLIKKQEEMNVSGELGFLHAACNGFLFSPPKAADLLSAVLHIVEQKVHKYSPTHTMHQQNPWTPTNKSASSLKYGPCWIGKQILDASNFHWQPVSWALLTGSARPRSAHTLTHLDKDLSCSTCARCQAPL